MLGLVLTLVRRRAKLRRLWRAMKPRPGMVIAALALLAFNRVLSFALPASSRYLVDDVIGHGRMGQLRQWILLLCGVMVLEGLTGIALEQVLGRISAEMVFKLRCAVFNHLSSAPLSFFESTKSGTLANRLMADVDRTKNMLGASLLDMIGSVISAVTATVILFRVSPAMAWPVLVVCVVLAITSQLGAERLRRLNANQQKAAADLNGRLVESFSGMRFTKTAGAEQRDRDVVAHLGRQVRDAAIKTMTISGVITGAGSVGFGAITVFALWGGAGQIAAGALSLGSLMTFMTTLPMLNAPIRRLVGSGGQRGAAWAAFDRMVSLFDLPSEHEGKGRTVALPVLRGDIRFDAVTFAYGDGPVVLRDVTFHAPAGTVTGIVGPSGAGKSTIAALMSVLYEPRDGRILIDQHDVSTVDLSDYRRQITQVLQDPFLFDGSIRDNLLFACPQATEARWKAACEAALVADFAERLPHGYDTMIGERGVRLSGGQKQRIAIARALLSDARLIVLDEATSNIDAESERRIFASLHPVLQGRTAFIISHRLQATRHADQILVIERGHLVARGTHDQLMAGHRWYASAYETQTRTSDVPSMPVG